MVRPLRRHLIDGLPRPLVGSHAVTAGDFVFVGGLLPTDFRTGLAEKAKPVFPLVEDGFRPQGEYIVGTAETILSHCGASFADALRIDQFITERAAAASYLRARNKAVPIPKRPASTLLHVPHLPLPAAKVSGDIIAAAPGVAKRGVFTEEAPVNFNGAPHGAQAGGFIFIQGQIASDFAAVVAPGAQPSPFWYETAIERETQYIISTLATILEAADSSLHDVVKASVYLTDMTLFPEFERVWAQHFSSAPPARTVVPVSSLGSPDCHVEINVIAVRRGEPRRYLGAENRAPLVESEAVRVGNFVFLSNLVAGDYRSGLAPEAAVPNDAPHFFSAIERQVQHTLMTAERICKDAGSSLEHLCWSQVFLTDMHDYYGFARAWNDFLGMRQPVVTVVGVPPTALCPGARLLVDVTAFVSGES